MPAKKVVGKIYHTKTGQPYKILPNGRARFIKRTSGAKKKGGGVSVAGGVRIAGGLKKKRRKK